MDMKSPMDAAMTSAAPAPPAYEDVIAEIANENSKSAIIQVEPTVPLTDEIVITQQPAATNALVSTVVLPVNTHEVSSNLSIGQSETKTHFLGK